MNLGLRHKTTKLGLKVLAIFGFASCVPAALSEADVAKLYASPLSAPEGMLNVYHLGHSLVGRDMPAMVAQLAGAGHGYDVQLGWGTSLKAHWEPDVEIGGFKAENDHLRFRPAKKALQSGDYDAVVLTEMVEIEAAIEYFDSAEYLQRWAKLAWGAKPDARIYLYETWHEITDPRGWLTRLDEDLETYWETEILHRALAYDDMQTIYVIPAGQVFAHFMRAVQAEGGVDGINEPADLFLKNEDGEQDPIHINDMGVYLVALTHYAVLYQRDPHGLPFTLKRADGSKAQAPGAKAAAMMQDSVWHVVRRYKKTGLVQEG